jgi:glutathione S-transferase
LELVIGTKRWSTWSLRPWLVLRQIGVDFTETLVELRQADNQTRAGILPHSPSGLVPALKDEGLVIVDSLAICEYLAERFPDAGLWPSDANLRALARSAACEMHSGFQALRQECPMALEIGIQPRDLSEAAQLNVERIQEVWSDLLRRSKGPFLCGAFGIVDAFYTPVATRFRTYGVSLTPDCQAYVDALLARPDFLAWAADA